MPDASSIFHRGCVEFKWSFSILWPKLWSHNCFVTNVCCLPFFPLIILKSQSSLCMPAPSLLTCTHKEVYCKTLQISWSVGASWWGISTSAFRFVSMLIKDLMPSWEELYNWRGCLTRNLKILNITSWAISKLLQLILVILFVFSWFQCFYCSTVSFQPNLSSFKLIKFCFWLLKKVFSVS